MAHTSLLVFTLNPKKSAGLEFKVSCLWGLGALCGLGAFRRACVFCFVVAPFFLSLRVLFFLVVARDFSCRGVGFFSCRGNGAPSSGLLFLKAATGKQT